MNLMKLLKYCASALIFALAINSCSSPITGGSMGTIRISGNSSRIAVTDTEKAGMRYAITLTGPGETITREITGELAFTVQVVPGKWDISVRGYNQDYVTRGMGTGSVTVNPGTNANAVILLKSVVSVRTWAALKHMLENPPSYPYWAPAADPVYIEGSLSADSTIKPDTSISSFALEGNGTITRAPGFTSQVVPLPAPYTTLCPFFYFSTGSAAIGGSLVLDGGSVLVDGPLILNDANLTIKDNAVLRNNYNTGDGGAINAVSGSVTMNGGTITGNRAANGGGIYVSSTLTMNGGIIGPNNFASSDGGGVYIDSGATITGGGINVSGNISNGTYPEVASYSVYSITIASGITHGAIIPSAASAVAGTTINLTVTPATGYQLSTGTLKFNDGSDHAITGTSFTMPSANVTISAAFSPETGTQIVSTPVDLQSAIDANKSTIIIDSSFSLTSTISKSTSSTVTLLAASGTISITRGAGFAGNFINVTAGTLILGEENESISLVLDGAGGTSANLSLLNMSGAATTTIKMNGNTMLKNNQIPGNGAAVNIAAGTFEMNGGAITGNTANVGGGVYLNSGEFTMNNNAAVTGNVATVQGGGVCISAGTFTMNDTADISANQAQGGTTGGGGGVYMVGGTFNMNGGTISANIASGTGYATYAGGGGGGGVFMLMGAFNMAGGTIYGSDGPGTTPNTVTGMTTNRGFSLAKDSGNAYYGNGSTAPILLSGVGYTDVTLHGGATGAQY